MNMMRLGSLLVVVVLVVGILVNTPVRAQQTGDTPNPQDYIAIDGLNLQSQDLATQELFIAVWGIQANLHWVFEHNDELVALGYPVPEGYSPLPHLNRPALR